MSLGDRVRQKPSARGVAVLAAALIAAGAIAPAFASKPIDKGDAKKIAKKQINALVPGIAQGVLNDFIFPVGPIHMNVGDADVPIGTWGPFSLRADCFEMTSEVHAQVLITTSEPNSTLQSYDWYEDFQPADGDRNFSYEHYGNDPNGGAIDGEGYPYYYDPGHAIAPSGTDISGAINAASNFDGADCYFSGFVMDLTA